MLDDYDLIRAVKLLKEIAHQDARRWGEDPFIEIKHFLQSLVYFATTWQGCSPY